ncbi:MAG: (d)CMP kinase [Thermotogae bacterium]|nr:(d)CMP kinase [Thermotogota bacterium]
MKVIAIDGPAGSGKSTVARIVADRMNMIYLDTGAMYRAVTYYLIRIGFFESKSSDICSILNSLKLEFNDSKILLNGKDISEEIRSPKIDAEVSDIAKRKEVRAFLTEVQRKIAKRGNVVIEGRDIGTVVIPEAPLKVFLTASVKERARRRYLQLRSKGIETDIKKIEKEIRKRDEIDSTRKLAPLVKPRNAVEIDTTNLSVEEVVNMIIEMGKERFEKT